MRIKAGNLNERNILNLIEENSNSKIVDLGCDEGSWTLKVAEKSQSRDYHGLDIVDGQLEIAAAKGINIKKGDLNKSLPYEDEQFDLVHSNQVIEHLFDLDNFLSEIYRILKPNGYCITSTENIASWINTGAQVLGWQPFSLTNISTKKLGMGNPLALNSDDKLVHKSMLHTRILSTTALKDLFKAHGFIVEKITGAGYFPLPGILGKLDPRHSHFITIKARKPA